MRRDLIRPRHLFYKIHGYLGLVFGLLILWMLVWGVLLANREPIRAAQYHFDDYSHPKTELAFPAGSILIDDALAICRSVLNPDNKNQQNPGIKRIELKWESGAPVYRARFADKNNSEVTVHALTGKILISPGEHQDFKKLAQDLHVLRFLPDGQRWLFDCLAIMIGLTVISGIGVFFTGRLYSGTTKRKLHIICSVLICLPFLMMAITGLLLNHDSWLESENATKVSQNVTQKPSPNFEYNLLPVSANQAVVTFQEQFPKPQQLRRVVLSYSSEYQTSIWEVEPFDGMRIVTVIDAYTGRILKPAGEISKAAFVDQLHELLFFGRNSKYVIDVVALLLLTSLITGFMLVPQMLKRRWLKTKTKTGVTFCPRQ